MDWLEKFWPFVVAGATALNFALVAINSAHALLFRRDTRTTIAWIGLLWLAPYAGSIAYWLLGVNRIRRKGGRMQTQIAEEAHRIQATVPGCKKVELPAFPEYVPLMRMVEEVTDLPLLPGNRVTPLSGGDEAYPAMLEAIDQARASIAMQSYIFDNDRAGREFALHLKQAVERGVEVRVLIDDVGSRYKRPSLVGTLRRYGVPCDTFLPTRTLLSVNYANLRNHRKILVIDGDTGFTGGMNIRETCRLSLHPEHPVQDLHFRLCGPVVAHLQQTFVADWAFTSNEELLGDAWFPEIAPCGEVWARGVPDGPDEDLGQLPLTVQGAISVARKRIDIVTPYFLPDPSIVDALCVAAMRGVQVRVVVPRYSNVRPVRWASATIMEEIIRRGCLVYDSPPPFDHTKLMLVDEAWTLLGSSNWDPRSLRLNFEFNVECYDLALNQQLSQLVDAKVQASTLLRQDKLKARSLPVLLRDRVASLFTPYL